MTMTFSLREDFSFGSDTEGFCESTYASSPCRKSTEKSDVYLFADKLSAPKFKNHIKRPRLNNLLEKTLTQFGAALITGRTGTGKSALAANFAGQHKKTAWFSITSADCDWNVFANYFQAVFKKLDSGNAAASGTDQPDPAFFVERLFQNIVTTPEKRKLIVLDDIHNVFDADWFAEFFTILLHSLTTDIHLLMLSRSSPPIPLWRLRSKQVLSVVEEKLLAFNPQETKKLFKKYGLSEEQSLTAHRKSYGRISRLKTLAESLQIK